MNEKALSTFMAKVAEAQERLAELTAFVDDHMHKTPEDVSWGKAGDAGRLVEMQWIRNLHAFFGTVPNLGTVARSYDVRVLLL